MKKIFGIIFALACLLVPIANVCADSGKIEVFLKVGQDTIKINGKDLKVEKPLVANGVTLVPLRVITEAFGAEVTWNEEEKSATLNYKGTTIKLHVDDKIADVDGNKVTLSECPVLSNGNMMVPLRFISENFGSDVKYDESTDSMTITKEFAGDNSIKDYSLILKKTTKERIGDSYYGWSMNLPKNLKISYRSFDATHSQFSADDKSYVLWLDIEDKKNETIESIKSEELEMAKGFTLLSHDKVNKDGQEYIQTVYKGNSSIFENRVFLKDEKIYYLSLSVKDQEKFKSSSEYTDLLDSFQLEFNKDDRIEDLSDLNSKGFRVYENKKLKWSMDIPGDWNEYKSKDKENEVSFVSKAKSDNSLNSKAYVKIFSIEKGLTLDQWVNDDLQEVKDNFNSELVKVIKTEDAEINNVKCKKIYSSISLNEKTLYVCDVYIFGKDFRYQLEYSVDSEAYNDSVKKAQVEAIISSFKFTDLDTKEIGKFLDPSRISDPEGTRKISSKDYKWSFELPANWTSNSRNNDGNRVAYYNEKSHLGFNMNVAKNMNLEQAAKYYEDTVLKINGVSESFKNDKIEECKEKGTVVKKYYNTYTVGDTSGKETFILLYKNGFLYTISIVIPDLTASEKNVQIADDIWKSLQFE